MQNTYEMTLTFYPTDDYRQSLNIRYVVPLAEVMAAKNDPRKWLFEKMIRKLDAAIKE